MDSNMNDRNQLGAFLKQVINWDWATFCLREHDEQYTNLEATVFSLVRIASSGKLNAIKLAIDRVDGKLITPIKFEYPRIYNVYPFATERELPPPDAELPAGFLEHLESLEEAAPAEPEDEDVKLASLSIRETLEKLANSPRKTTPALLQAKELVEQNPRDYVVNDEVAKKSPLVKSVIAANLMQLAQDRNFDAINEVFDQIDGKLVETFKVIGEDMSLVQYSKIAPWGAVKNKDGVYQIENLELQQQWQAKLEVSVGSNRSR